MTHARDAELCQRVREHVGPDVDLMYDGSAGFDLPDAVYLGDALADAGYLWYEEPIREFSVTAYKWLAERVDVPLLVARDLRREPPEHRRLHRLAAARRSCAPAPSSAAASPARCGSPTSPTAFRLRAEVHGPTGTAVHLCMAIPNTTYYESLVTSNPVTREAVVGRTDSCTPRRRRASRCRTSAGAPEYRASDRPATRRRLEARKREEGDARG